MNYLLKIVMFMSLLAPLSVSATNIQACIEASRGYWLLLEADAIESAKKQKQYAESICPKFEDTKNNKELSEVFYRMKNDKALVALVAGLIADGAIEAEPFTVELAPHP